MKNEAFGPPKLFVSYSGRDVEGEKRFIREFFYRLRQQPVTLWLYEKPDERIPEGEDIMSHCRGRIDAADFVIALVTPKTINSVWTRAEVAYARETGKPIVPVRSAQLAREVKLPREYAAFSSVLTAKVDMSNPDQVEELVIKLADTIGFAYSDPEMGRNFALTTGLRREIYDLPIGGQFENWVYYQLRNDSHRCFVTYRAGNLVAAKHHLARLIATLELELPAAVGNLYYPHVLRAMVELECDNSAEVAARIRQELVTLDLATSRFLDENYYGLLGIIDWRLGAYSEALKWFQEADQLVVSDGLIDYDLKHHIFWTKLALREPLNDEDLILAGLPSEYRELDDTLNFSNSSLQATSAVASLILDPSRPQNLTQLSSERLVILEDILRENDYLAFNPLLAKLVNCEILQRIDSANQASATLDEKRCAAQFLKNRANWPEAIRILEHLIRRVDEETGSPNLNDVVELALILENLEKTEEAAALCRKHFEKPASSYSKHHPHAEYDYLLGYLHWISGDFSAARGFFRRSGYSTVSFYERGNLWV